MQSHPKHALGSGQVRFHSKNFNCLWLFQRAQEALRPTNDKGPWVLQSIRKRKTNPKTQESETVGALEEILDFGTGYVYQTPVEVVHSSTQ
jgi:hypothetical protein